MSTDKTRLGTRLAGVALLVSLFACGDDTSPTAPPAPGPTASPTPTPPAPTVLIKGEEPFLAPPNPKGGSTLGEWDFTTTVTGTVGVTISYLNDASHILVWVTDRQCNKYQFGRDECFYLTKSLQGPRPRTLSASGVKPGTYTVFVSNDGPYDEVVGYQVTLLPDSGGNGRLSVRLSGGPAAPGGGDR